MDSSRKRMLIVIASVASAAIGVAAIGIPLALSMGTTVSSQNTLTVSGPQPDSGPAGEDSPDSATAMVIGDLTRPIMEDLSQANFWLIPVDAPMSTFPPGDFCSDQQRAWLSEHAQPYRLEILPVQTRVQNTADSGASLALTNVRLDGEWTEVTRTVVFVCVGIGDSGTQSIKLHADGSPGTWSQWNGFESVNHVEGSVATLNLAPGEVAEVNFELPAADRDFSGRIIADTVGEEEVVVLTEHVQFSAYPLMGFGLHSPETSGMRCTRPGFVLDEHCTYADAAELLLEAGRQAGR